MTTKGGEEVAETRYVTPSGRTVVVVEAEHPRDWRFVIDGKDAFVREFLLYRDGGTRRYVTSAGEILFPHRLGSVDRTPRLDRELLTAEEAEEPDRLVELRNSMRGADVPVALLGWMQEVERRLDVLNRDVPLRVEQRPDEWLSIRTPDRVFEGRVLYVEEVPHPVNGDDHVAFKLPVPHGLPCSRAAVMLVALDDPPLPVGDDVGLRFEDEYPDAEH